MPKYILSPNGKIKKVEKVVGESIQQSDEHIENKNIHAIASSYTKKTGSTWPNDRNLDAKNTNLPFLSEGVGAFGDGITSHIIKSETISHDKSISYTTESADGQKIVETTGFVSGSRHDNFLANPSFGTGDDSVIQHYTNFNDYFNDKENEKIFATELEMISGLDLKTFGFSDLTKYIFWLDYIVEAAVYIAVIEGILALEELAVEYMTDNKTSFKLEEDFQMELGNYGAISYSVITRYIYEILKYPKDKNTKTEPSGILERLGAFYVGLSFYINTDPLLFLSKFGSNEDLATGVGTDKLSGIPIISKLAPFELFQNIMYYMIESFLSLSGVGRHRLTMLIRRFHQKSDWNVNKLYKAKSLDQSLRGHENFLVELNYYYVTFIIERMNIGLKLKNYYKNKKSKLNKLNRSGRIKDSNDLYKLSHTGFKTLGIHKYTPSGSIRKNRVEQKQSISISALPQAFIMPNSLLQSFDITTNRASEKFQEAFVEEHVASYFIKTDKPQERLSKKVVAELEDFYEKEMMPFYFQDIRTNEILGFHAFIESYSDQFTPQYQETTPGYGRIDKISHYINTSRSIGLTFTLAAMSKEDHDLMWYQINKIVSMVYPQWSSGLKKDIKLNEEILNYEFPFTQVPIASPLIRIRLGDVIKSNYTTHALEKIHGSGNIKYQETDYVSNYELKSDEGNAENDAPKNYKEKHYLLPGRYKNLEGKTTNIKTLTEIFIKKKNNKNAVVGYAEDDVVILGVPKIIPDSRLFNADNMSIVSYISPINFDSSAVLQSASGGDVAGDVLSQGIKQFTQPYYENSKVNNPFAAAQETTLGKGLAGFIKSLDINTQDQLWETSVKGSKAPMAVKITIQFEPIHDLPPGLDSDGAMRAPVYNTGRIINTLYGDVYDSNEIKFGRSSS